MGLSGGNQIEKEVKNAIFLNMKFFTNLLQKGPICTNYWHGKQ
jgi:hypothetical protein